MKIAMLGSGGVGKALAVANTAAADLGWSVHDCGGLRGARLTEPMALLWIEHAIRFGTRDHVLTFVAAER